MDKISLRFLIWFFRSAKIRWKSINSIPRNPVRKTGSPDRGFSGVLKKAGGLMNILTIIILGIYIILGGGSTIALTGYMFIVIAQKIIRKIKYGTSLYA